VSISTRHVAVGSAETASGSAQATAVDRTTALLRRSSAQPSRRAVLHVQASGDAAAPTDLASWCTERAFHFYVASLQLPARAVESARHASRDLRPALADLDAACTHLLQADGMASLIVTAHGRGAIAAALWSHSSMPGDDWQFDRDRPQTRADALILAAPAWPSRGALRLNIACPVLVVGGQDAGSGAGSAARRAWPRRPGGPGARAMQLGSHVTWVAPPDAGADPRAFLGELGRWLGAYMYGRVGDQLL